MNILQLILHIGSVVKATQDGEALFNDLVAGKSAGADAVKTLQDISALINDNIITLPPQITVAQAQQMLTDLQGVL